MKKKQSGLRTQLKQFRVLVAVKRFLWALFSPNVAPPTQTDSDYFAKQFANNKNIKSLVFDEGLVRGQFRDVSYVMKIRPRNILETHIYIDGLWEPQIASLISAYLMNGGIVIDIGANIGATSIPLAKYHTKAEFYLFEPHPGVFVDLSANVAYNKLENVKIFNSAISDSLTKSLPFYAQKNARNFGLSSFKKNPDIEEYDVINVECVAIDHEFRNCSGSVKVIKIDTQGTEFQALLSAEAVIRKHRPAIFFEFESDYFESQDDESATKTGLLEFFKSLDYHLYLVTKDSNYLPKVNLASYFKGDILAVPAPSIN